MKPELKPEEGWKYRLILCDNDGNAVPEDFLHPQQASQVAAMLFRGLEKSQALKEEVAPLVAAAPLSEPEKSQASKEEE